MKKIHEKIKKILELKVLTKILYTIGILIAIMVIFSLGVATGFHKASFRQAWEEHYEDNFGFGDRDGGRFGMKRMGMIGGYPNAHGAIGNIIKIELPTIIVRDKDNIEKVILLDDDTSIQKMKDNIKQNDLRIDDFIIVIGSPNDKGQVEAKFIRIMPSPNLFIQPQINETISQ